MERNRIDRVDGMTQKDTQQDMVERNHGEQSQKNDRKRHKRERDMEERSQNWRKEMQKRCYWSRVPMDFGSY